MSWNGYTVVDMDSHVYEEADRSYQGYIDPEFQVGSPGTELEFAL